MIARHSVTLSKVRWWAQNWVQRENAIVHANCPRGSPLGLPYVNVLARVQKKNFKNKYASNASPVAIGIPSNDSGRDARVTTQLTTQFLPISVHPKVGAELSATAAERVDGVRAGSRILGQSFLLHLLG